MRYSNAVARFLLEISLLAQISLAILSVLISLFFVIFTPWLDHNPLLFVVPVILVSWTFRYPGLYACLFLLAVFSWSFNAMITQNVFPAVSTLPGIVVNACILLMVGLVVVGQRDAADVSDEVTEDLEIYGKKQYELNVIKDRFLQNVNHELRTPLTAIYGYLELLLEHSDQLDTEMRTVFLQHAMQSCDELQLLVNNVLDSMGIEKELQTLPVEQLVVRDIVFEVLERFDPQSVQRHNIDVDVPDYVVVLANAQYLRQVLRNLLANAFKYTPPGTPISISGSLYGMVVHPLHASPEICICVKDVGPGIPPEEMPLLFGQFVRLRRDTYGRVRGSGLGLFLSKQFVEAMDGRIWVESEGIEGKGSTFCFTLPCVVHPKVQALTTEYDFLQFKSPVAIE
ncbi:hypothetical protein KDW_18170 [Dictyobacter vulcani]|uniref:histidine kinase n=1 Tax=Dictyobacter vulcani TaxID=2607529 RepID=A0A5J4KIP7_9CHLR|nr:HAMP domain-containing sensor histidine kinase [Dictyobacter vulcani]GER87655.1 hypothetical protein KDW_18170 [Dictyobacter vulcani]